MFNFNSHNKWSFSGNVGKAPEAKTFGEGEKKREFVSFSVAVKQYNKEDPKKPNTMWVNVQCSQDRLNKMVKDYVLKGSVVAVEGELNVRTYQKTDGFTGISIDVRAEDVTLYAGKKDANQETPTAAAATAAPAASNAPAQGASSTVEEDDIPF